MPEIKERGQNCHSCRGDAAWRATRQDKQTAPRAPPQATTMSRTAAAANPVPGFINIEAGGDYDSTLPRPSYEQFARYEAFLASSNDLQAFGIMGDDDDCSSSIEVEEFIFFEPGLATSSPSHATVLKRGAKGAR